MFARISTVIKSRISSLRREPFELLLDVFVAIPTPSLCRLWPFALMLLLLWWTRLHQITLKSNTFWRNIARKKTNFALFSTPLACSILINMTPVLAIAWRIFVPCFLSQRNSWLKVISPPRGVPGLNRQSPLGRLYGSSSRSSSSSSSSASADIDMDLFSTNLVNHNLHAYLESTVKNFCLVNNVFAQSGGLTSKRSLALFFELFWKEYFALVKTTCKNVMKPRQEVDVSQLFRNVQSNATRGGDLPIWPEFTKMRVGDSTRNVNSLEYKFQHLLPLVPSGYRNKTTITKYISCPGYEKFGARCAWLNLFLNPRIFFRELSLFHKRFLVLYLYLCDIYPVANSGTLLLHTKDKGVVFRTVPNKLSPELTSCWTWINKSLSFSLLYLGFITLSSNTTE